MLASSAAAADENPLFDGTHWDEWRFTGEPQILSIERSTTGFVGVPRVSADYEVIYSGGHRRGLADGVWYMAYVYRSGEEYLVEVWAEPATGTGYSARRYPASMARGN